MTDDRTEVSESAIIARLESNVRTYSRLFPTVFSRSEGSYIYDEGGRAFLDFFSGAGALNYGHNNPRLKSELLRYIAAGGVSHALDMATVAKRDFLRDFDNTILKTRGMDYKMQFPGPTGADAVEAALKLARKVTRRRTIIGFLGGFHGVTIGALSVTSKEFTQCRAAAGVALRDTVHIPYCDGCRGKESLRMLEEELERRRGIDVPAGIILETVQGEGGVCPASFEWLRGIEQLARDNKLLLIVDDIQVGCGRTGPFFSFEAAGIQPDVICLSKSLSGYGLPLSLVLFKRNLDVWEPGEHTGTFRGNNLALVTASAAMTYWESDDLTRRVSSLSERARTRLRSISEVYSNGMRGASGQRFDFGLTVSTGRSSDPGCEGGIPSRAAGRNGWSSTRRDKVAAVLVGVGRRARQRTRHYREVGRKLHKPIVPPRRLEDGP